MQNIAQYCEIWKILNLQVAPVFQITQMTNTNELFIQIRRKKIVKFSSSNGNIEMQKYFAHISYNLNRKICDNEGHDAKKFFSLINYCNEKIISYHFVGYEPVQRNPICIFERQKRSRYGK